MNTLTKGLLAGTAGTAVQELSIYLKRHGAVGTKHEDEMEDVDPWTRAPAPAQLLQRAVTKAIGVEPDPAAIPLYTNVMHWGYGVGLGVAYALGAKKLRLKPATAGVAFGMGVWAQSYATLVPLGLYKWPWHYSAKTIAKDVSYHLAYGAGTAAGYRLLSRRG